ncbi:MAG: hypothetical protein ACI4J1_06845 [Ruminiclostridium sp.]
MKTIREFYRSIISDKALEARFLASAREHRIDEFLKENGVEGTKLDLRKVALDETMSRAAVSDDSLSAVSGGTGVGLNLSEGSAAQIKYGNKPELSESSATQIKYGGKPELSEGSAAQIKYGGNPFELDDNQMSAITGGTGACSTTDDSFLSFNIGSEIYDLDTDSFYILSGKQGSGAATVFIFDVNGEVEAVTMTLFQLSEFVNTHAVLIFER